MQASYWDAMLGASEAGLPRNKFRGVQQRTELYLTYIERAPALATPQRAKSFCEVGGSANKQAKALRRLA